MDGLRGYSKKVRLDTLLKNSDIVTLHLPLTDKTKHIINKKNIKLFKKGSILINTARGGLVETEALIYGLKKGILKGVALDVIEGEKVLKEELDVLRKQPSYEELRNALIGHALLKFENVIITPHLAYNTWEALERIDKKTVETIYNFLKGKRLYNRVV